MVKKLKHAALTLTVALVAILASIAVLVAYYDCWHVSPYIPGIRARAAEYKPYLLEPSEPIKLLRELAEKRNCTYWTTTKLRMATHPHPAERPLIWHTMNALWHKLLTFHLSNDELFLLWCSLISVDGVSGLTEAVQLHYNKEVINLSRDETIEFFALTESIAFSRNADSMEGHKRFLAKLLDAG